MKLNNRGWGLNQMLFWCAILFLFLIVAVILVVQLAGALNTKTRSNIIGITTYDNVEDSLTQAATSYVEKYYSNEELVDFSIIVTSANLLKYDLISEEELTPTSEKAPCSGYSLAKKENDELSISSYIKCENYETAGYESWRLGD